jgi:hypothetical protein
VNALVPLPVAASPVSSRAAIAQRIAALLGEREANQRALRAASARFKRPPTPAPTVTYRGPFGPIEIDVDGDWVRELLPDFSPRSRRGKRLRNLLQLHDEHYAQLWADREASGVGPLVEEQKRIEAELEAVAKEACSLGGHSAADVALQAAALLAARLCNYYDCKAAPAVLEALLEVVGAEAA